MGLEERQVWNGVGIDLCFTIGAVPLFEVDGDKLIQ